MLGDVTLHHLISHRLQVEHFRTRDDFLYRRALKELRRSSFLEDFFTHLPKAFLILAAPACPELIEEWKSISESSTDHPQDTLYKKIERCFAGQLPSTFFISVTYHTLIEQCTHLFFSVRGEKDRDIKRYHLMTTLRRTEELLTNNQALNPTQESPIRTAYSLLLAYQWSVIQCYYRESIIRNSLTYDSSEIQHLFTIAYASTELAQLAQVLKHDLDAIERDTTSARQQKALATFTSTVQTPVKCDEDYISSREAAALLGKTISTINRYSQNKKLKTWKQVRNRHLYLRAEVEALKEGAT